MAQRTELALPELYTEDETAWLEAMADLIGSGNRAELDYASLQEYLTDMAKRDRREVESRLVVLIAHVLKWRHQPEKRSGSWRSTIVGQRHELEGLAGRGVLRAHAESVLAKVYPRSVELAAIETGLPAEAFPAESVDSVTELLTIDLTADPT